MYWDLIKIGVEDVQKAFGISENLFEKYVVGEIKNNQDLMKLMMLRDNNFDWTKETPLGGAGTSLNACVLYCLIRYYFMRHVIETGVSGGYYSAFMLAALRKNDCYGTLISLELSDDAKEVGKLVPLHYREVHNEGTDWELELGKSSLDHFKEWKAKGICHAAELYSHDSLHTMSHMLKELNEFKQSLSKRFFVFIDDEKSDNFWQKCLQMKAFEKQGFDVKCISGAESRLNGHLGGFIMYERKD